MINIQGIIVRRYIARRRTKRPGQTITTVDLPTWMKRWYEAEMFRLWELHGLTGAEERLGCKFVFHKTEGQSLTREEAEPVGILAREIWRRHGAAEVEKRLGCKLVFAKTEIPPVTGRIDAASIIANTNTKILMKLDPEAIEKAVLSAKEGRA